MQVGVGLPNTIPETSGEALLEWMRQADQGPFSCLGVLDRIVYDACEPLTTLAAAAAVTHRIRLATVIVVAPLRNAAVLAKQAATIDALSGGRLTLGLALGAREDDYQAAGVAYGGRAERLAAQLVALRDTWENEAIGPHPTQPGGPELLLGGQSDQVFARVARFANGYVHGGGPPRAFAGAALKARAAWIDAGRPGQPRLWGQGYFALGGEEVVAAGAAYLRDYYAFTGPFAERIAAGLLTTPQAILQFVRGYGDEGCDELVLLPATAGLDQLHRLADVLK
ncbi:MAG: LLM class flavin-dependent oxidoreductase [Chloroflexota bacterium]